MIFVRRSLRTCSVDGPCRVHKFDVNDSRLMTYLIKKVSVPWLLLGVVSVWEGVPSFDQPGDLPRENKPVRGILQGREWRCRRGVSGAPAPKRFPEGRGEALTVMRELYLKKMRVTVSLSASRRG
jgi:hypothetical protein